LTECEKHQTSGDKDVLSLFFFCKIQAGGWLFLSINPNSSSKLAKTFKKLPNTSQFTQKSLLLTINKIFFMLKQRIQQKTSNLRAKKTINIIKTNKKE
jgi:hypothetical protein